MCDVLLIIVLFNLHVQPRYWYWAIYCNMKNIENTISQVLIAQICALKRLGGHYKSNRVLSQTFM